ncbi:putative ribonuclease H-like domain-containing protein [Tanacetum coccineum]
MTESPLVDSSFAVPVFSSGDDPIACLNKAMDFLTVVASSRFSSTNNQLRTSSNPRNHATIQDGRVTVQQVQGRQGQSYSSTSYKSNATSSGGNNASGQAKVVKCYNCQGEGHMARQCTQPKRPRNVAWYKDKAMLTEAQETEDLDTYDSDCDDISNAKVVLMANISNYGSDVISEVPHSETYLNDMENQSVHAMQDFKQTPVVDVTDHEIQFGNDHIPRIMRTKDEAHEAIIKFIKNIQVCLNAIVRNVRTDNGTEFVNQTLREFYENVGISHQTSVARTPQQNSIVERRNQTLIEAAPTMFKFSKALINL